MFFTSLAGIVVLTVVAMFFGFPWYLQHRAQYKLNAATVFGVFFGVVGGLLVAQATAFWPDEAARIYAELTALSGAGLGWLLGMWLSPIGSGESTKFGKYWTAIGVGSGFTLKWAIEKVGDPSNRSWIAQHPFYCLIFSFPLVLTTAAIYSTRAYNDTLIVAPRKPLAEGTTPNGDSIDIKTGATAQFYAAVVGPNDPLSHWQVLPAALGDITADGLFTAGAKPGDGHIIAFNVEDPTLSNAVAVRVV